MHFSSLAAAATFVTLVLAQQNPISEPTLGSVLTAGKTFNITWNPTTTSNIKLLLKKGLSTNLQTAGTILSSGPNNGFYVWTVPSDTVTGTDYAVEIDDTAGDVNYTPQFTINGVASSSSSSAAASTTSSTTVSTKSVVSTSTIATNTVYASSTSKPVVAGNSTITGSSPSATNGTVIVSSRVPSGGETTSTSTSLPRPSATAPSSAGAVKVAMGLVSGAVFAAAAMLL